MKTLEQFYHMIATLMTYVCDIGNGTGHVADHLNSEDEAGLDVCIKG